MKYNRLDDKLKVILSGLSRRREEGTPLLEAKFKRHLTAWYTEKHINK